MPNDCSDLMVHANQILKADSSIVNTIIKDENKSLETNILDWFKSVTYEDFQKAQERGGNFDFEGFINNLPTKIGFGGSDSKQQFEKFKKELESGKVIQMESKSANKFIEQNIQNLSPDVIKAWRDIMDKILDGCNITTSTGPILPPTQLKKGLNYEVKHGNKVHTITVYYLKDMDSDSSPIVESFNIIGGKCIEGELKVGSAINNPKQIIIQQTSSNDTVLSITTNKEDLNINFGIPSSDILILKTFVEHFKLTPLKHVYTFEIPEKYKILCGGYNGNDISDYIITSSYPSSLNSWTVKISSRIKTYDNSKLYISIVAIYDPTNKWDIQIDKTKEYNKQQLTFSPPTDRLLIGGGVELELPDHPLTSEQLNKDNFQIGLLSNFPSSLDTWKIKLNNYDINRIGNWILNGYCISIRKSPDLEIIYVTKSNEFSIFIDDNIYYTCSGGLDIKENNVTEDIIKGSFIYIDYYSLKPFSSVGGWWAYSSLYLDAKNLNVTISALAMKYPHMEFLSPQVSEYHILY